MVLSEAILISAYFLGLRRAYRLVLKTERKVFKRVPRVQQFVERNLKHVFRLAQRGIKEVEQRDLAFGKYLGGLVDKMPSWEFFRDKHITRREKVGALRASLRAAVESRRARRAAESHGASAGEAMKIVKEQEKVKFEGQPPGKVIEEHAREESKTEVRSSHSEGVLGAASRKVEDLKSSAEERLKKASIKEAGRDRSEKSQWRESVRGEAGMEDQKASHSGAFAARKYHSVSGLEFVGSAHGWREGVLTRGRGAAAQFIRDQEGEERSMPVQSVDSVELPESGSPRQVPQHGLTYLSAESRVAKLGNSSDRAQVGTSGSVVSGNSGGSTGCQHTVNSGCEADSCPPKGG